MRSSVATSVLKRAAIAVSVVGLAVGAFGATSASAESAKTPTINTYPDWNGTQTVQPFGCPNTTTYGETITIPAGMSKFSKFSVSWVDAGTGSFTVRGELYAWDPSTFHATGHAIAQTKPRVVSSGNSGFFTENFKFKNGAVTAGQQYVVFASVDKDYSVCSSSTYEVGWAAIDDDSAYPGGTFVYQNNGGAGGAANWTTVPWTSFGFDLAFKAFMK